MATHIDTKPVVAGSTQATHWTCPQAPAGGTDDNTTHHLRYPSNICRYCKVSRPELQARHEQILEIVNRNIKAGKLPRTARTQSLAESIRQYADANALTLEDARAELGTAEEA